jgi:hypothetical protein
VKSPTRKKENPMKRTPLVATATLLTMLLLSGSALAGGWGPYFSWGLEKPGTGLPEDLPIDLPDEWENALNEVDLDVSLTHLTFGIMYESAPARDKLFSYRGTLGFDIATDLSIDEISVPDFPFDLDDFGISLDLDESSKYGLSTNHTFAFGIIRTERLKWWAGPGIGLTFNYYDYRTDLFGIPVDAKAANISIGGGGETGVNIHLGTGLTVSVGGGIHWRAFGLGGGSEDVGSLVWGNGPLYFIQTALLFRTGPDRGHQTSQE